MLENLKESLESVGDRLVRQVKRNLVAKGKNVSGVLEDSISVEVIEEDDGKLVLEYTMVEYGYYQDEGVKGANPKKIKKGRQKAPYSRFQFGSGKGRGSLSKGLDKWIVQKGIAPRDKQGRFLSRATLKFLMSRSIYNQGIEPSMFFTDAWDKMIKEIEPELQEALEKDFRKQFIELIR